MRQQLHRTYVDGRDLWSRTLFVVVGSHGEVVGRTAPARGSTLDDAFLDVPLLLRDPRRGGERIHDVVDTTCLPATLAALLDAKPLPGWPQASLPPWGSVKDFAYSHTARARLPGVPGLSELVGLETEEYRLLMTPDEAVVDFGDRRGPAGGPAQAQRRSAMVQKLSNWLELCRKEAVVKPSEPAKNDAPRGTPPKGEPAKSDVPKGDSSKSDSSKGDSSRNPPPR